ncbi:MAG: ATP-binding protein [Oligoflexus sp.]
MNAPTEEFQLMLRECEKEQVHLTQFIQPHGCFLAFHRQNQTITHYSSHINEWNQKKIEQHVTTIADFLGPEAAQALARAAPFEGGYITPWIELPWDKSNNRCFALPFQTADDGIVGLDLELYDSSRMIAINSIRLIVYSEISRLIHEAINRQRLSQGFVQALKDALEYDRVMIYHFDEEWNGKVVAEAREPSMTPYFGLHWPASDIPSQVRELMILNRSRLIANRESPPAAIISDKGVPFDQTLGSLRSVSPIHQIYLKNMGVQASLTLPLISDQNELWGLVACHHRQAKRIDPMSRMLCEQLAEFFAHKSMQLHHLEELQSMQRMEAQQRTLIKALENTSSIVDFVEKYMKKIKKIVASDGFMIVYNGKVYKQNIDLHDADLDLVISTLQSMKRSHAVISRNIDNLFALQDYQGLAGIAAFPLSADKSSWIAWFRGEYRQTVRWAGDRTKPLNVKEGRIVLEPRASFAVWREKKKGQSLAWKDSEITIMQQLAASLIYTIAYENEVLAKKLIHEAAELKHKNDDLRKFSYIASHDLKSPISAIAGFCQILQEKEAPHFSEKGMHYLNRILEQTKYMGNLLDNLLAYSVAYHVHTKFEKVDLKRLCIEVYSQFQFEIDRLGAKFHVQDLPVISGDSTQLRQLFCNFLQNSLKFSAEGRQLEIEVRSVRKKGAWLIQWIDNGIGISEECQQKVFEWFNRDTSRKIVPGSGMGLSICKRIVDQHHGKIWIDRLEKEGTKVSVLFPDQQPHIHI